MALPPDLNVVEVPDCAPGDYSVQFFRRVSKVVAEAHQRFRFDLVHGQELAGLFLRPPQDVPLVLTVHGTLFTETHLDRRVRSHLRWGQLMRAAWGNKHRLLLAGSFRRMLDRADLLLVDSEFTFRELLQTKLELRPRLRQVPLGLDLSRYPEVSREEGQAHDRLRIALLGRVQEVKGLGMVLEAAKRCTARGLPVVFNVGGTGAYLDKLRGEVTALNLKGMVVLHGRVEPEDVPRFMAQNDLFLFPDLTHPAFGLVALEAMRYGLPVIGTTNGAIPETVTEGVGWTYQAWEVDELVELLMHLARHPEEVRIKGAAALARGGKWTSEEMAEATIGVYREIAKRA